MDEYICKNSFYEKPCTVYLYEYSLEWQRGEKNVKIPYANIVSVLLKKRGKKFSIQIESDYQGTFIVSNRFYLSGVQYEDRSRQYTTFVRMLHLHIAKQMTTSFFTGTSMKKWSFFSSASLMIVIAFQMLISIFPDEIKLWITLVNIALAVALLFVSVKLYPRPYSGNEIPLHFLPPITS